VRNCACESGPQDSPRPPAAASGDWGSADVVQDFRSACCAASTETSTVCLIAP